MKAFIVKMLIGWALKRIKALWQKKEVRALALSVVERAAHLDLDGDGKKGIATEDIKIGLKSIAIKESKEVCGELAELAYQRLAK